MPGFARACTMLCIGTITLITIKFSLTRTIPPPNGTVGKAVGNNTPISGGLLILVALGAGYGGKKVWDYFKKPGANF